jgi:hypothetical protein
MSTQAVSGLSIQQELQILRQNRRSDAQPHNNHEQASPAVIVSLSGTQSLSGTSTVSQTPNPEPVTLDYKQFRAERSVDMKQLGQALASGDLSAAQAAYDKLVQLGKFGPLENGQTFKRSDRAQDFQAIGQALQSGDLASAEQAFTALKDTFNHLAHGGPEPPVVNPNSSVVINVTYQVSGTNATPSEPPVFHGGPKPPVYGGGTTTPPVGTLPPSEPPVSGGGTVTAPPIVTLPPSEPPVSGGGTVAAPPIGTLPPSEPPVSGGGTTTSNVSEIVINIGGSGTSQQQSANGELVVNLAAPSAGSPEELKLNFAGSNGSSNQLTIDVAQTQGQNGSTGEQISIDLSKLTSNENIVLNLYGNSSSTQTTTQTQSSSLNVNA